MFLFDTHVHTRESSSCGQTPAAAQAEYYKRGGYDGVVITDHFQPKAVDRVSGSVESWSERLETQWRGYEIAKQFETDSFTVLHGVEIRFKGFDNDYLVFGADKAFFNSLCNCTESSIEVFSKAARRHGRIALFQAHPFRNHMTVVKPDLLDGIEVYNGNSSHNSRNDIALMWAQKNNLRPLSGSDCHTPWMASPGGILLEKRPKTDSEFAAALLEGSYKLKNREG